MRAVMLSAAEATKAAVAGDGGGECMQRRHGMDEEHACMHAIACLEPGGESCYCVYCCGARSQCTPARPSSSHSSAATAHPQLCQQSRRCLVVADERRRHQRHCHLSTASKTGKTLFCESDRFIFITTRLQPLWKDGTSLRRRCGAGVLRSERRGRSTLYPLTQD